MMGDFKKCLSRTTISCMIVVYNHAACRHSGGYLSAESRVQCAGREEERRGGLARSTELAEGGRPGSRPAVPLNLDLVSIGFLGPHRQWM